MTLDRNLGTNRVFDGPGPFSYIDMGGMFTILRVRDDPNSTDVNGWYAHPNGRVAKAADPECMRRDGIEST
jgi:hypothetical protein